MQKRIFIVWMRQGAFGRLFLLIGLGREERNVKGGRKVHKQRFTREKETPIVIWKSEQPRCYTLILCQLNITICRNKHG